MRDATQRFFSWRATILSSDLPATTRHLLLTLACYMDVHGEGCFPSTKRLARETGYSERTICTHLEIAQHRGWITVRKHGFGGQKWRRNEYVMSWPKALNEVQHVEEKGTEAISAPSQEGTEPLSEGTEPDDIKALNEVQSNTPDTSPGESPPSRARAREAEPFATAIPEDWWPPKAVVDRCRMSGCPEVTPDQVELFKAHYAGELLTPAQVEGRFRKWMLYAKKHAAIDRERGGSKGGPHENPDRKRDFRAGATDPDSVGWANE